MDLRIIREIQGNDIVLYMNGLPGFPQCEGSAFAVQVLSQLNVRFRPVNVAEDSELRKGLRSFADWPVFPQLYIKGEFIGSADILREMMETGELRELLEDKRLLQTNR